MSKKMHEVISVLLEACIFFLCYKQLFNFNFKVKWKCFRKECICLCLPFELWAERGTLMQLLLIFSNDKACRDENSAEKAIKEVKEEFPAAKGNCNAMHRTFVTLIFQ